MGLRYPSCAGVTQDQESKRVGRRGIREGPRGGSFHYREFPNSTSTISDLLPGIGRFTSLQLVSKQMTKCEDHYSTLTTQSPISIIENELEPVLQKNTNFTNVSTQTILTDENDNAYMQTCNPDQSPTLLHPIFHIPPSTFFNTFSSYHD